MIELAVMQLLAADPAITDRIRNPPGAAGVGLRLHLGRVPQGQTIDGGTIVVSKITGEHDYGLAEEAATVFTTLQIDCYDLTPEDASSLAELVAVATSGAAAIGAVSEGYEFQSALIIGERTEYQRPLGGSDDWRPRDSRDYRIHHQKVD